MPRQTNAEIAEQLLGEPLADWVEKMRRDDRVDGRLRPGLSWARIAAELEIVTNSRVVMTGEALRQQYGPRPVAS